MTRNMNLCISLICVCVGVVPHDILHPETGLDLKRVMTVFRGPLSLPVWFYFLLFLHIVGCTTLIWWTKGKVTFTVVLQTFTDRIQSFQQQSKQRVILHKIFPQYELY